MKEGRDRTVPITAGMIEPAKENLIPRRVRHMDRLGDKVKEERVRRVLIPMPQGDATATEVRDDDIPFVIAGLVEREGHLRNADPIYQEVIPRQLTSSAAGCA